MITKLFQRTALAALCLSILSSNLAAWCCDDIDIHGFISQGVIKSSDNKYFGDSDDTMFDFHEVGLNFSTQVSCDPCDIWAGIQLFTRDLGCIGNNDIIIDWAIIQYTYADWLGFRVGKVKLPLALYNKSRDADVCRTWILYPQSVYDEMFRDYAVAHWGFSIFGNVPLCFAGDVDYEVALGALDLDGESKVLSDAQFLVRMALGVATINDFKASCDYSAVFHLSWNTCLDGLRIGGAYARDRVKLKMLFPSIAVPMTQGSVKVVYEIDVFNAYIEYVWDCLTLTAEYLRMTADMTQDVVAGTGIPGVTTSSTGWDHIGYYFMAEYNVTDCWTVGGYYAISFPDAADKHSTVFKYRRDYDLTLRYDFSDCLALKVEFHKFKGAAHLSQIDNNFTAEEHWYMGLGKVSLAF